MLIGNIQNWKDLNRSISFAGNYLYSFSDQETARDFAHLMKKSLKKMIRSNFDGSQRFLVSYNNLDVFVLSDKDYDNYQKAVDSVTTSSGTTTTANYIVDRLREAYIDNAIKVDCTKDVPSKGLKFCITI